MIKKFKLASGFTLVSFLIGLYALTQFEPGAQIPTHWNAAGEVDGYSSPLGAFAVMPVIQLVLLFFFSKLHFLEPRGENLQKSWKAVVAIITSVFALLTAIQFIIFATAKGLFVMEPSYIIAAVGVMLMIIGNYFGKLHSTFFIGLRTPWTLSSETVWRKTHRLGGWLAVAGGFVTLVVGLALPGRTGMSIGVAAIMVSVLVPVVYSWYLWFQERKVGST